MPKTPIIPVTPWVANASSPFADQSYMNGDRPPLMGREAIMLALGVDVTPTATGTTYYVNESHPSASDGNAGTSDTAPWSTMTYALTQLSAGDELKVTGSYSSLSDMTPANSGTSGNPIIIRGHGVRPTFTNCNFLLETKSYIVFDNLEITGSAKSGVRTNTSCTDIHVFNCYLHALNGAAGTNVGGVRFDSQTGGVVYNCLIDDIKIDSVLNENGAGIHGYGQDAAIIAFNTITDCDSGIYLKNSVAVNSHTTIGNDIDATTYGYYLGVAGASSPASKNLEVYNNRFRSTGIYIKVHETATQSEELLVRNNVFDDQMFRGRGMDKIRAHSNICLATGVAGSYSGNSWQTEIGGTALTTVYEADYNCYPNAPRFTLDANGGSEELAITLTSLRAKVIGDGNGTIQVNNPETNSVETAPTFDGDYIATNLSTSGKSGGQIGIEYAVGTEVAA